MILEDLRTSPVLGFFTVGLLALVLGQIIDPKSLATKRAYPKW